VRLIRKRWRLNLWGECQDTPGIYNDGPILGFAMAGNPLLPALCDLLFKLYNLFQDYRHAWGRNPLANLKADGIPLDTLRNDNYTVADMYEIYTG
jgi:hypothetical protein